jgi:putative acetyltransferase
MALCPDRYSLRPSSHDDACALADVTLAAIRSVWRAHYSEAQLQVWAARLHNPQRFVDRSEAGHTIIVAVDGRDYPIAYALLEPVTKNGCHLDMLYCHPDHTRRGLADLLLADSERQARAQRASCLFTEASELACPAFARAGYRMVRRRDLAIEGIAIHNYAMEKRLS